MLAEVEIGNYNERRRTGTQGQGMLVEMGMERTGI